MTQSSLKAPANPNLLRVLLVGETKVGKTLLIRRLCHQVFSFSSAAAAGASSSGRGAADGGDVNEEDYYFASKWGPTIGFDVDCLVRETYGVRDGMARGGLPNPNRQAPPSDPSEGKLSAPQSPVTSALGEGSGDPNHGRLPSAGTMSYRGTESATTCANLSTGPDTVSHAVGSDDDCEALRSGDRDAEHHSRRNRRPVVQTVELYELGGTHAFSPDCALPLFQMDIDGIVFVYDRANTSSTTRLSEWYAQMKRLFPSLSSPEGHRPRLMLVGTQLAVSSPFSRILGSIGGLRGSAGTEWGDRFPSDDALVNPELRLQAQQQFAKRRTAKPHRCSCLVSGLSRVATPLLLFLSLAFSPSLILSEQYQEERSTRSFRFVFRSLESLAAVLMWIERVCLYVIATVLFGFFQSVVVVRQPTVRGALDHIKEDRLFAAHCHVCHLYDRFAFEASVDEIMGFFDTLHREKMRSQAS